MSEAVSRSAVAVSASTRGMFSSRAARAIFRYSGRKLCPHWLMQWASSTARSDTRARRAVFRKRSLASRSGEMYRSLSLPSRKAFNTSRACCASRLES